MILNAKMPAPHNTAHHELYPLKWTHKVSTFFVANYQV